MNRGLALALVVIASSLSGCTEYESPPPGAADAGAFPKAAQSKSFDFVSELRTATRACVASETEGPSALAMLSRSGFVPYSELGIQGYTKSESLEGKAALERIRAVRVSDPNQPIPCRISVFRRDGYTALATISDEMARLGYGRRESGRIVRFVGKGLRFSVDGSYSTYDAWTTIRLNRVTAETDRTCSNTSLSASFREGCN